ncbi:hypothetical protein ACFVTE_18480 [Arthrobacter sp. NPDC058097]|uniref:hypothetical protein n=1 Tax=Arthrobacter sp. NPDC058097 TaxID=3346340 RepID=UPI0036DB5469
MGTGRGTGKRNGQPPLATEQYSELNATFYSSGGPHEYIRARLQSIIFTLSDADEAEAIVQQDLFIGTLQAGGSQRLSQEVRQRYALMESTVLLHHAGEALLRLWMAHKDSPSCPWLEVASLTTARIFKEEAEKHASDTSRIPRSTIASVFLGGSTREDAHVEMTEGQWERSIDGFQELLRLVAHTITSEATLYNAAKHGLVGLPGDQADIVYEGKRVAGGGGITYLEKTPDNTKFRSGPHSWWLTTSFTNLEANLFLIELTLRAISSLWAVARRRHLGVPGEVVLISLDEVLTAVAMGPIADNRMLSSFSESLVTYTYESGQQQFGQRVHRPNLIRLGPDVVEAFDRVSGEHVPMTFVALPLREQDKRTPSTSNKQFFRSSPPGSSSV